MISLNQLRFELVRFFNRLRASRHVSGPLAEERHDIAARPDGPLAYRVMVGGQISALEMVVAASLPMQS